MRHDLAARPPAFRLAIVLGLLTTVGPLAIDMYLPSLPAMGPALNASKESLQTSLMAFYLAMGLGQLIAGPMSDTFGRKRPVYFGLGLFIIASIGCALSQNLSTLLVFRLMQGLGACVALMTPRAIVRDLYTGENATRLMGWITMIYSVSPLLAPLLGSAVAAAFGWRAVFATLALVGRLLAIVMIWRSARDPAR